MTNHKIIKDKAYFKRFQVKPRRRREGKTDYKRRRGLVRQDKNKYNSPKYRLVVRITNKYVIVQIVHSLIKGDVIMVSAYSSELPRYGIKCGLKNYAAAYATGLLAARRLLKKLGLDKTYVGAEEVTGEDYYVEAADGEPAPFYALLDVGLARTSTGARIFAAMKGAADGGIEVPHGESRLAGFDTETETLDADKLRHYLHGGHVADYMRELADDSERYDRQFSAYKAAGIGADDLEGIYKAAHKAIRADPEPAPKKKAQKSENQRTKRQRLTYSQRKDRIRQKIESAEKRKAAQA